MVEFVWMIFELKIWWVVFGDKSFIFFLMLESKVVIDIVELVVVEGEGNSIFEEFNIFVLLW